MEQSEHKLLCELIPANKQKLWNRIFAYLMSRESDTFYEPE